MKRHNGLTLEITTGQPNTPAANRYLNKVRNRWGNKMHNLRHTTFELHDHLHKRVNAPRTTETKRQLARATTAVGISDALATSLLQHDPISLTRSGGIVALGIAIGINGYLKSEGRWSKQKNQLQQNQIDAKNEFKAALEFLGKDEFMKAALILEASETGIAVNGLRSVPVLEAQLEKFDQAVDVICKVALGSDDRDDMELALRGLDDSSEILKTTISALRTDIEALSNLSDRSLGESRYKRNAEITLPRLLKGYSKICATRNDISNSLNGLYPLPKSGDLTL